MRVEDPSYAQNFSVFVSACLSIGEHCYIEKSYYNFLINDNAIPTINQSINQNLFSYINYLILITSRCINIQIFF